MEPIDINLIPGVIQEIHPYGSFSIVDIFHQGDRCRVLIGNEETNTETPEDRMVEDWLDETWVDEPDQLFSISSGEGLYPPKRWSDHTYFLGGTGRFTF